MNNDHELVHLLPSNRTPLEEGVVLSFSHMVNDVQPPFDLLNPDRCAPAALVYLANDRGVTNWLADDEEAIKRSNIKNCWSMRAMAGTRAGLNYAAASMGYSAQYSKPEPYVINITAWRNENQPVDPEIVNRLFSAFNEAKNERDTVNITLAMGNKTSLALAAASESLHRGVTNLNSALPSRHGSLRANVAGASYSLTIGRTSL